MPEADYFGLPRLTFMEGEILKIVLDDEMNDSDVSVHGLAQMVMQRNPLIQKVIEHDTQQYLEYETDEDVSSEDIVLFCEGLQDGYEFFVGCVTWVRLQRSGITDVFEFLEGAAANGDVPPVGRKELDRIKSLRAGNAPVELNPEGDFIETSKDHAEVLAGDYCFESSRFEALLDVYIEEVVVDEDEEDSAFVAGFEHGLANAVQMYVAAYEEQYLNQVMKN